jgi:hypothetical protein
MPRKTQNPEPVAKPESEPGTLFEQVGIWLEANDWSYSENSEKGYYSLQMQCGPGSVRVIIDTDEKEGTHFLLVYVIYPERVPEARRPQVMELLTRANYRMTLGNFEMDSGDGEIRFRISLDLVGQGFTDDSIERAFAYGLRMGGRLYAPMLGVAFGEVPASAALEKMTPPADIVLQ